MARIGRGQTWPTRPILCLRYQGLTDRYDRCRLLPALHPIAGSPPCVASMPLIDQTRPAFDWMNIESLRWIIADGGFDASTRAGLSETGENLRIGFDADAVPALFLKMIGVGPIDTIFGTDIDKGAGWRHHQIVNDPAVFTMLRIIVHSHQ